MSALVITERIPVDQPAHFGYTKNRSCCVSSQFLLHRHRLHLQDSGFWHIVAQDYGGSHHLLPFILLFTAAPKH
jgi:hypothetical protein